MPPAVIAAAIGVAGAVGASAISSSASKKAGRVQSAAADRSAQLQQQTAREGMSLSATQFGQTRTDLSPWRTQGAQAANVYGGYLGLNQPTAAPTGGGIQTAMYGEPKRIPGREYITPTRRLGPVSGYLDGGERRIDEGSEFREDMGAPRLPPRTATGALQGEVLPPMQSQYGSPADEAAPMDFRTALELSPQYQFLREEGMRDIEGRAAAGGLLQSGKTLKALSRYNQNLAYGLSEGYLNRLAGVSAQGQSAAAQTGAFGSAATGQQAGMLTQAGRGAGTAYQQGAGAQAAGYLGSANAWAQGIQGVGQEIGGYLGYSSGYDPSGINDPVVNQQLRRWG